MTSSERSSAARATTERSSAAQATSVWSSAARAIALVWRSAPRQTLGYLAATLAGAVVPVGVAWLTKLVLDRLVSPSGMGAVLGLAVGLAAVGLMNAVVPQAGHYLRAEVDRRVGLRAHDELFKGVERFSGLARFEDPALLDRLRLAQQSATSPGQIVDSMLGLGSGLLTLFGFVGSLAVISPLFTGIVLAAAVPAIVAELRLSRRRARVVWEVEPAERWEFFYSGLLGSAEAAKEIRLFGIGGFLRGRMLNEKRIINAAKRRMDRRELAVQSALAVLSAAIAGGGLIWVITAAGSRQLGVGDVSMFIAAVGGVQAALEGLVTSTAAAHQQLLMFGHFVQTVEAGPDLPAPACPRTLPPLRSGIELRDVWFRYTDEHPWALRGVDLFIPSGEMVALVGRNGAGKSTLVKLLCRFYDPTRGSILWDGVDLRDVTPDALRERIGAVFQDFMAYDFSAADNIAVGDISARTRMDRLRAASERAGIHETIAALPRGYDTLLTRSFFSQSDKDDPQTGVVLSGGQWQRLALARAFLREDRDLMILDEPSAGLDAEAEHEVHTKLREIRAGETSLLITHRLGAVRDADRIVVLSDGAVAEQGGHADLLSANGTYARLYSLQAAGYSGAQG